MSASLPLNPNLNQLKNQARDLLKAYRSGDSHVIDRVFAVYTPKAEELTLREAQQALAREYGFASWRALLDEGRKEAMNAKKKSKHLTIIKPEGVDPTTWDILMAARAGHKNKVAKLIDGDPGLIKAEYWYTQPIHFAVREGRLSTVKALLDHGADSTWIRYGHEDLTVVARDRGHDEVAELIESDRASHNVNEKLPIHEAVLAGKKETVAQILGADSELVSVGDHEGWTPLHHAVSQRDYAMVNLLCEKGADVDAVQKGGSTDWYRKRGQRPVDLALSNGDREMIGYLLSSGARYTLDLAVAAGDKNRIGELLKDPLNIDEVGGRPMAIAAEAGSIELVGMLLDGGVDPNLGEGRDAPQGSALWKAVRGGHHEIARMLLDEGGDPNQYIESSGAPMHQAKDDQMKGLLYRFGGNPKSAADFVLDDNIDALAALAHRDPQEVSKSGCGTVFTFVVSNNKPDMLELLLAQGVRVPQVVTQCRTYLWQQPELTRRLLESGMDPNLPNWQWVTPMHNLAQVNPMYRRNTDRAKAFKKDEKARRERLVDLFLEFGADINAIDEEYRSTPLGWAAREAEDDMVDILLKRGADPNGGEPWAKPFSWAQRRGNKNIAKVLVASGASG
jgi:ankyrin repeat protein